MIFSKEKKTSFPEGTWSTVSPWQCLPRTACMSKHPQGRLAAPPRSGSSMECPATLGLFPGARIRSACPMVLHHKGPDTLRPGGAPRPGDGAPRNASVASTGWVSVFFYVLTHTGCVAGCPIPPGGAPRLGSGSKRHSVAGWADPGWGSWDSPGVSPTFGALVLLQTFS